MVYFDVGVCYVRNKSEFTRSLTILRILGQLYSFVSLSGGVKNEVERQLQFTKAEQPHAASHASCRLSAVV